LPSQVNHGNCFVEFTKEETEQSVPERFEKQVIKYPGRVALRTRHHQLTYENLNKSANQLARAIESDGDEPIAMVLGHDTPAIVAIVAAFKADRNFILLDPALPAARIRQILNDSGANLIVTNDQGLAAALNLVDAPCNIVNLDRLDPSIASHDLGLRISPDNTSYILYTSGSTGRPKGVAQTHRNDLHNVRHHTNSLHLSSEDRLTLLGSYSTGQGMQDLLCALLNGSTLYPWSLTADGLNGLADWLITESITVYHSSATVFRHFVRNLSGSEQFPHLRVVRLGSEPVSWKDVESYKRHFSNNCVLVNALSCSEARTFRQCVLNKRSQIVGVVPVGYAVEGKDVVLFDEYGNELGPNRTGEITIRSRYLSPGYWKDPDLTRSAFLPDPEDRATRIYRTGDLGRLSDDGSLEHLGRKDAQVKIRGFRVETYEIELALLQNPEIDQAFVIARDSASGDKYLAAYVIVSSTTVPTSSGLRMFLKERLPDYMVPSTFVFLDALPLTPTGKIDRHALPEPAAVRPALDVPLVAPDGPIEEALATIWVETLGVDEIGANDNFFDVMGNSLLAMQMIARVEKTFRVQIPLELFFERPTIASLSRNIATVALEFTREQKPVPMEPRRLDDRVPLSFFQERIWFMDQWEPGLAIYSICQAYHLRGPLNVWAVEESVKGVVERHQILRTTFLRFEDQPAQIVAPCLNLTLQVIDLRALPEAERGEQSLHLANEEAKRFFDLAHGPLLRATLLQLGEDDNVIIFTVHQMVCDGWSMQIFLREFWELYKAFTFQRLPQLPEQSFQYADFAIWQRQWLKGDALTSQLSFWKEQLGDSVPILNLPSDHPRPAQQSFHGERMFLELPPPLTQALKELSHRERVTLFMTLLAGFKCLLYRYTGQEDFTVGFPIADRHWAETSGLIGFFVNTLVARTSLSGRPTFREFLLSVRDVCLAAYAHQDLSFEKLVEELRPQRDLTRNPLFQVMFSFQNVSVPDLAPLNITATPINVDSGTAKLDLTLSLAEREGMLVGFVEYATDLFRRSTIEQMIAHYQTLLQGIVVDVDQPISTLPLLTEVERQRVLIDWNNTEADYPYHSCIHELFEAQVGRTPDAVGLECEGRTLTYRELNIKANQLACYLQNLGVGPEKLVGICVEPSIEMVVGLLGILKAGGGYVPLDPAYPSQRLDFMLEDAQVSVIVTQEKLLDRAQHSGCCNQDSLVCLDRDWPVIERQNTEYSKSKVASNNLAYVIYTSGSTGTPKGVVGLHQGAINRFCWMWKNYPFQQNERSCIRTSLNFVDSVWEIFGPMLQGVPALILSNEVVLDPQLLVRTLAENHVTRISLVPSLLRTILDVIPVLEHRLPALKWWSCSGEPLTKELVERFHECLPHSTLLNLYGCSEVSADVTCFETRQEGSESSVSIGRPIDNTKIYILDSCLQLLPVGIPGELYVGGSGLARGYLNRPELTSERFISNPFRKDPEEKIYRTGDVGRYLPNGNIEYLGRADDQVKLRGYRIELGEIEATLNQHPGVRQNSIVARNDAAERGIETDGEKSDPRLIGYIVPAGEKPSVSDLRGFLREKLPEYMVPSVFIILESLPLNPNGKIDRIALSSLNDASPYPDYVFVQSRNEVEELVAQVWREVLKRDQIGVCDNFFELGGHSLLATRVVARLRSNFSIDLPLRKLFELPTVAGLAQYVNELLHNQSGTIMPPIVAVPRAAVMPASFSQQRLWFLHELDPESTAYNISIVFSIRGALDVAVLEDALNEIIARHEILRTIFLVTKGVPGQSILPEVKIILPLTHLESWPEGAREAEASRIAREDARRPFDLRHGPLMRARVIALSGQDYMFFLNFDHTVLDGWSMGTLFKELGTLYEAFAQLQPSPLPPLPVQYADYSMWQKEYLRGDRLESQLAYWKRQLEGDLGVLNLPTDHPRPAIQTSRGVHRSMPLSKQLTETLKGLSRREGVTLFMTLLAAFKILFSRHAGQDDVVVGSTIAGRSRPEIEGLVGFFINVLPLRTDLSGHPAFTELLKRVREVCLGAYTHQDVPFEKIVETINPSRDLSRNPLFQVVFNMADVSERVLTLQGCDVKKESFFAPEAKFDITLYPTEKDGSVELAIVYNADLFDDARIEAVLNEFGYLLAEIAERPDQPISQYSLVTPEARTLLPDPTVALSDSWEGAIHTLVTEQAQRGTERVAVVGVNEAWTYGELDRRSNQLANYLIAQGVKPKDVVTIYAQRNAALVIALLGILKAGAVFAILDPAYPASRLSSYLRIARPLGWVQMNAAGELPEELLGFLATFEIPCRINFGNQKKDIAEFLDEYSGSETGVSVNADDPAYIAFTSGSTGEPKSVLGRHGPITHFFPWQEGTFDLSATDRFSLLSGLAYNHLHRDIFTPLALGATLHVPPSEIVKEPARLTEWLRENSISVLHLTPALGQLLLTAGTQPLPAVRRVFLGGDILTRGAVARIRELMPNATIGCFYGATETQRAVSYYEIPLDFAWNDTEVNRPIPLGRGIKDVQLLLLNKAGQLAGVGELAELHVRSPHLAEGYVGDETLTNERFLRNPFTSNPTDRLYRTGELGRYLPDGNVEWAGRNDRRVNIRGFRVELEEVEAVLKQHPMVTNAAVVLQDYEISSPETPKPRNPKLDQRLVAYVAADENQRTFADLLHGYVNTRLPDYMVPSHFVVLDRLPLSPNGKVDYKALPSVEQSLTGQTDSLLAPRNDFEAKLCEIFSQVLGIERVGVNDDFFRLGGHSLLAAQAAARIKEAFGVALELRMFLESPTVAALVRQVELLSSAGQTTVQSAKDEREEIEI
jgi:amino acid adenylation domain-containing protein